jgi:hypothetical protein
VTRSADSCTPFSNYMRHRVHRNLQAWKDIGASGQVLRWIREGVTIPFLNIRPPPPFNQGVSLLDATPEQLTFVEAELARFVMTGAWERTTCNKYVSRFFLIAKPGNYQWRFIVDLRHLNNFCVKKRLRMESLLGVRHLTRKGNYMFSFDLKDEFYALGIVPEQIDFLTVNVRGQRYCLAGLPMGWSLSPYHFCAITENIRTTPPTTRPRWVNDTLAEAYAAQQRQTEQALPMAHAVARSENLTLRGRLPPLSRHPGSRYGAPSARRPHAHQSWPSPPPLQGFWGPTQYGHHLGIDIDTSTGYCFAPSKKL